MSHPSSATFPQPSFPSSSPLPLLHQPNQMTANGAFYSATASHSAPVLSAPGTLAPSTSSSSTHSGHMQHMPFVGSDGSGGLQHPAHSPMQTVWSSNNFATFTSPQPHTQPQQHPTLVPQLSLPAAGRLSSHDSSAPMSAYPQHSMPAPAYSSVPYMASQQQQQQQMQQQQQQQQQQQAQPGQTLQRFHTPSPPTAASHLTQPHQPPQQQQLQQHPQQSAMQPNMQPNLMFNQYSMQPHPSQQTQFNGQQPHSTAALYTQPSSASYPSMRMPYPPQPQQLQQQQQPQLSPPHDRQTNGGPGASPHPQQQPQPPSPRHANTHFSVGNFPPGTQVGNIHGMLQPHQPQPQAAAPFFNGYIAPAAASTPLLAATAPPGVQLVNYSQSMPVTMAPSNMPSAVVMASTASTPSTYTAVHHPRNKAARHHPLASAVAAVAAESKAGVSEVEGSSDSTAPAESSPNIKPAPSPHKSKFPRPSASSHPPFQLLKTESKRPYATLLYTANKRMLPSFLAKKQALFGQEQLPPSPDSPDMVTIKVRVMALTMPSPPAQPPLSTLYFVAADISAIIHSRKSNIAKAVSSFPDDEKKRASVLCMQQNGTVSTHSLTVLSWKGVERLLNFSCAPVALPFLEWLRGEVYKISSPDSQTSLSFDSGENGKMIMKAEIDADSDGKLDAVHTEDSSPADSTASVSPSTVHSFADVKVESQQPSLPAAPTSEPHRQQHQAVA